VERPATACQSEVVEVEEFPGERRREAESDEKSCYALTDHASVYPALFKRCSVLPVHGLWGLHTHAARHLSSVAWQLLDSTNRCDCGLRQL